MEKSLKILGLDEIRECFKRLYEMVDESLYIEAGGINMDDFELLKDICKVAIKNGLKIEIAKIENEINKELDELKPF